jgi:hypothetical protein
MFAREARASMRTRDRRSPYIHRMSVCANFRPDRPSRLAAYTGQNRTGQDRTEQNVTETVLQKYNILEPVSVGGWTQNSAALDHSF